ncbi:hypothetical protein [Saccharothrix variisporea]|uniref:hypothetical protein n=1 Tax=Saccharothrix variisporea TaxID=543527 RepID=UPI000EAD89B7
MSAPYPVPDTSTTQVITAADLPQTAAGPFAAPSDGVTTTLSAPNLSDAPTFATTVPPTPPAPADAPTFATGAQPAAPPPADAPTFATGTAPAAPTPAPEATPAAATAPAPTDQSATQVIKPETLAAASPTFATAAQTDLQKATTALDAVDKGEVKLDLDKQAVQDLVKLITQARDLVDSVHRTAVDSLDVELKFGNNWVGEAISRRLREVAVGDETSAVSVIGDFLDVLFEVEKTIRDAARNLEDADDEAADAFGKAAGEVKGP